MRDRGGRRFEPAGIHIIFCCRRGAPRPDASSPGVLVTGAPGRRYHRPATFFAACLERFQNGLISRKMQVRVLPLRPSAPIVQRPGHRIVDPVMRVRFPLGAPSARARRSAGRRRARVHHASVTGCDEARGAPGRQGRSARRGGRAARRSGCMRICALFPERAQRRRCTRLSTGRGRFESFALHAFSWREAASSLRLSAM